MDNLLAILLISIFGIYVVYVLIKFFINYNKEHSVMSMHLEESNELIDDYVEIFKKHPDEQIREIRKWKHRARLNHDKRKALSEDKSGHQSNSNILSSYD